MRRLSRTDRLPVLEITGGAEMRRREFIAAVGSVAAGWPLDAVAQNSPKVPRVAVLMGVAHDAEGRSRIEAFYQGLKDLGWSIGSNIVVEVRWAAGSAERIRTFAAELVALEPTVILANTTPVVAALRQLTQTIPIVFVNVADPVGSRFVEGLARPGGNVTGFSNFEYSQAGKWLGMLKEIMPELTRVGILFDPRTSPGKGLFFSSAVHAAAPGIGVQAVDMPVQSAGEIESSVKSLGQQPRGGLIVTPDPFTISHREPILAAASVNRCRPFLRSENSSTREG